MSPLDFLRTVTDAAAQQFHGVEATITVELPRKDAERFLFELAREFDRTIAVRTDPATVSAVHLGSVFKYAGHNFRIVEKS